MLNTIIFAIFFFGMLGFFIYSARKFFITLSFTKPENRFKDISQRLKNTFVFAFLQTKLFRHKLAGFLHFLIYWGFLVLGFVVLEGFIEGFFPEFTFAFLGPVYFAFLGPVYSFLTLCADLFGAIVFVTVIFSLLRRYIGTPDRLKVEKSSRMDATFILVMIMLVMVTMFGTNVERIWLGHSQGLRPVSGTLTRVETGFGFSCKYFWWNKFRFSNDVYVFLVGS